MMMNGKFLDISFANRHCWPVSHRELTPGGQEKHKRLTLIAGATLIAAGAAYCTVELSDGQRCAVKTEQLKLEKATQA
jgi:hypothetical protein